MGRLEQASKVKRVGGRWGRWGMRGHFLCGYVCFVFILFFYFLFSKKNHNCSKMAQEYETGVMDLIGIRRNNIILLKKLCIDPTRY
jgi:hypothetical protein